jgi:hypothetical protein
MVVVLVEAVAPASGPTIANGIATAAPART